MKDSKGNFKVRALESDEDFFTKGKVYEFKNGYCIFDSGMKSNYYNDLDDLLNHNLDWEDILEEVKDSRSESIVIYRKDNEVVALHKRDGQVIKTAKAICCKDDEFDFKIGADLAYKRLMSEDKVEKSNEVKEEKCLRLESVFSGEGYGKVGQSTAYKDDFGRPLFVGDKVLIISDLGSTNTNFVVFNEDEYCNFVMGICGNCNQDTGEIKDWKVVKVQDFSKLKEGDSLGDIRCVLR